MNYIIKSSELTVEISDTGAELQSVKMGAYEYIWQGDEKFWKGRAPLLFPIVGSLKNQEYLIDGKKYKMPNHGIARINTFKVGPILCGQISLAPLLPKLRGHFAEFLNNASPVGLRILSSSTKGYFSKTWQYDISVC